MGWAKPWPCAMCTPLGPGVLPRPQPTLCLAPCPTDEPKERTLEGEGTIRDMLRRGGSPLTMTHPLWGATPLAIVWVLGGLWSVHEHTHLFAPRNGCGFLMD